MHATVILYGARSEVERFLRDVESQKFQLKLKKPGKKDQAVWVNGQARQLPFIAGAYDIIFPREYANAVINTLTNNCEPNRYSKTAIYKAVKKMFCKTIGLRPIPKNRNDTKSTLLWAKENVSILLLGIREDADLVECKDQGYKGWTHEAL